MKGNKNPSPATRFKKGNNANPLGGKLHDPEIRAIKRLTQDELKEVGTLVVKGDIEALKKLKEDSKCSVLQAMVASVAIRIISKGDMQALDVLLNRLIGKVKDELDMSVGGKPGAPQVIITLPDNGFSAKKDGEN